MTKQSILAFAASNSRTSINQKLARHAGALLADIFDDAFEIDTLDLNDFEMAIYSPERQTETGIPDLAHRFYEQISNADGIIISFAEYNGSYTAAYKNIFDWCSRIEMKLYQDKPMLVMSTSPGGHGGAAVFQAAIDSMPYFGGNVVASFKLGAFHDNFDTTQNALSSPQQAAALRKSVHAFGSAILLD